MPELPQDIMDLIDNLPSTYNDMAKYGQTKIPSAVDEALTHLVSFFVSTDPETRQELFKRFAKPSHLLLGYAFRMAVLAIRTEDPAHLLPGIFALALDDLHFDERDTLLRLSCLIHAALKVGENPSSLLRQAAKYANPKCQKLVRDVAKQRLTLTFLNRMGWEEGMSEDGFIFIR